MSDINCAVCGEPWESNGVSGGDMLKWEAELFRAGAGCPSCEGRAPAGGGGHVADHLMSVDDASDDPDSFALAVDASAERPAWVRPEDETVAECAGCDSAVRRDGDTGKLYWHRPTAERYYHHLPGDWCEGERDDPRDALIVVDGADGVYCPACADHCDECGDAVFRSNTSCTGTILYGDSYDPGSSFPDPSNCRRTLCIECFEAVPTCAYCSAVLDDDDETDDEGRGPCCREADEDDDEGEDEDEDEENE